MRLRCRGYVHLTHCIARHATVRGQAACGRLPRCSVLASPRLRDVFLLSQQLLRGGPTSLTDGGVLKFRRSLIFAVGQISNKNVGKRTETILRLVLQFQVDRACLQGEETRRPTNFGGKVE